MPWSQLAGVIAHQNGQYKQFKELYGHLTRGQRPDVHFISCSDSRLPPPMVLLNAKPGDNFVTRNVGNIIPPYGVGGSEASGVEFGLGLAWVLIILLSVDTQTVEL